MTDWHALYRAVLAEPDDDVPRLIYADRLEEEGESEAAAFIRWQVDLARRPAYDRDRVAAQARPGPPAPAELPPLPEGLSWPAQPYRRGLPAAVRAESATVFLRHADEVFARFPVESVSLGVVRLAEATDFASCPWLPRIRQLAVEEGLSGQAAERLLGSRGYERLDELCIGAGLTTRVTAAAVLHSPVFRRLTRLACRNDRGGGDALVEGLTRLADPPHLLGLDLAGNRLSARQLDGLLAAPALDRIEEIDLSDNPLGPDGLRRVAEAPLDHLRVLRLDRVRPGPEGVTALAARLGRTDWRVLTLAENQLSPATIEPLARGLGRLHSLDLRGNRIGSRGVEVLAGSGRLDRLVLLDLADNAIDDRGAAVLADALSPEQLAILNLSGNPISSGWLDRLKDRFGERLVV